MKKGVLISVIAFVAFVSAIIGAVYVLKKRGLLFNGSCCEFDFCDCGCEEDDDDTVEAVEGE